MKRKTRPIPKLNWIPASYRDCLSPIVGLLQKRRKNTTDISSDFEKASCLSEIFEFAKDNFYDFFGNEVIVTKAVPGATERRKALNSSG